MSTPSLLALAVVAFVVELALFGGVGAIALEVVGGGLAGWLAAAAATAAILVFWGLLMAPEGEAAAGHARLAWWCRRRCASAPPTG